MSIDYCYKHHEYRDTDYVVECPHCEEEHELAPIINAIIHFEDKIASQGMITNARDEEHLTKLKKVYKSIK